MAIIDFGVLSDTDYDHRTTTTVSVPDSGPLPGLPSAVAEEFSEAADKPDWRPTLRTRGYQRVVEVRGATPERWIWLLYAPTRREWVCWVSYPTASGYGSYLGD